MAGQVDIKVILDESRAVAGARRVRESLEGISDAASDAGGDAHDAAREASEGADEAARSAKRAGDSAKGAGEESSKGGRKAGEAWKDAGEKIGRVSDKVKGAGDALAKAVTAPMVAAGAASLKAAVDIDTSLTNVRKTVDGTEEDYRALKDAAIEFSRVNAVSPSELLDIEALGAQLGFTLEKFENGKTQVQEFGEVVSGLDIATNMSAEQAGTELAQFFNIMDEAKDHASNYASAIVGLGNSFATTESDISAMAMRIAGAGKNIGLSSADVLGLATALTSLGIEAEAGGTAISTVMSEIDKAVAVGSKGLGDWAEAANMSVEEFTAAWGDDAVGALDAVFKGMQSNVEEGGNLAVILEELGISSIRQTDMMKRLANSGDLMSRAVERANADWSENTALSAEVANRNESLAAKFEMLRNRVTEVAVEVGEPLADALMEAVDAAEPLFQAVEDGARAFAEMDGEQQRAILSAAGAAAALGPLLSVAGRVGGAVGGAVESLGELAFKLEMAGGAGAVAEKGLMGFARLAPAVLGVAALTAAIGVQADYMARQAEHAERVEGATSGLASAMGTAKSAMEGAIPATRGQADAQDELRASAEDALRAQADLASEMEGAWQALGGQRALLAEAVAAIEEHAGKVGGDAERLAELQEAVAVVNEITGAGIEVVDEQTGALSENADAVRDAAQAWIENAEKQAAANQLVQLKERELENTRAMASAQAELASVTAEYNAAMEEAGDDIEKRSAVISKYSDRLENARGSLDDLTAAQAENAEAQEFLKGRISGAGDSLEEQAASIQDLILKDSELSASLAEAGTSARDAASRIAKLGVSAEQAGRLSAGQLRALASVSDETFAALLESADGSIDGVLERLGEIESFDLGEHRVTVTDGGSIAVVKRSTGEVVRELGKIPGRTTATVTDNGTAAAAGRSAQEYKGRLDKIPGRYKADVNVAGASESSSLLDRIIAKLRDFDGKTYTATVRTRSSVDLSTVKSLPRGHAAGGFAIPLHAAGGFSIPMADASRLDGIVTRATMTQAGVFGEAGREYVSGDGRGGVNAVPIQNPRYMAPFANAVADAMGDRLQPGGDTYNINIEWRDGYDVLQFAGDMEQAIKLRKQSKGER